MSETLTARLRAWTPVALWIGMILALSTRTDFGPAQPLAGPSTAALAHVVLYGVLGFLVARALRDEGWVPRTAFLVGLVGCVAFGAFVEGVQAFVPGRNAAHIDVLLNAAGATIGLGIAGRVLRWGAERVPVSRS